MDDLFQNSAEPWNLGDYNEDNDEDFMAEEEDEGEEEESENEEDEADDPFQPMAGLPLPAELQEGDLPDFEEPILSDSDCMDSDLDEDEEEQDGSPGSAPGSARPSGRATQRQQQRFELTPQPDEHALLYAAVNPGLGAQQMANGLPQDAMGVAHGAGAPAHKPQAATQVVSLHEPQGQVLWPPGMAAVGLPGAAPVAQTQPGIWDTQQQQAITQHGGVLHPPGHPEHQLERGGVLGMMQLQGVGAELAGTLSQQHAYQGHQGTHAMAAGAAEGGAAGEAGQGAAVLLSGGPGGLPQQQRHLESDLTPPQQQHPLQHAEVPRSDYIGRRTRAHLSLRDVELEELMQQLPDHIDMEEMELANDDAEYERFLQALFGGTDAPMDMQLPEEDDLAEDPDFNFELAELDLVMLDADDLAGGIESPARRTRARTRRAGSEQPSGNGLAAGQPQGPLLRGDMTAEQVATVHAQLHCHSQLLVQFYTLMATDPDPVAQQAAQQTLDMIQELNATCVSNAYARQASGLSPLPAALLFGPPAPAAAPAASQQALMGPGIPGPSSGVARSLELMLGAAATGVDGLAAGGPGQQLQLQAAAAPLAAPSIFTRYTEGSAGGAWSALLGAAGADGGNDEPDTEAGDDGGDAAAVAASASLETLLRGFRVPRRPSVAGGVWSVLDVAPLRALPQAAAVLQGMPPMPNSAVAELRQLEDCDAKARKRWRLGAGRVHPLQRSLDYVRPALQALAANEACMLAALVFRPSPPRPRSYWADSEDALMAWGIQRHGTNWRKIASALLPNRTAAQLASRHKNMRCRFTTAAYRNAEGTAKQVVAAATTARAPLTDEEVAAIRRALVRHPIAGVSVRASRRNWTLACEQSVPHRNPGVVRKLWQQRVAEGLEQNLPALDEQPDAGAGSDGETAEAEDTESPGAGEGRAGSGTAYAVAHADNAGAHLEEANAGVGATAAQAGPAPGAVPLAELVGGGVMLVEVAAVAPLPQPLVLPPLQPLPAPPELPPLPLPPVGQSAAGPPAKRRRPQRPAKAAAAEGLEPAQQAAGAAEAQEAQGAQQPEQQQGGGAAPAAEAGEAGEQGGAAAAPANAAGRQRAARGRGSAQPRQPRPPRPQPAAATDCAATGGGARKSRKKAAGAKLQHQPQAAAPATGAAAGAAAPLAPAPTAPAALPLLQLLLQADPVHLPPLPQLPGTLPAAVGAPAAAQEAAQPVGGEATTPHAEAVARPDADPGTAVAQDLDAPQHVDYSDHSMGDGAQDHEDRGAISGPPSPMRSHSMHALTASPRAEAPSHLQQHRQQQPLGGHSAASNGLPAAAGLHALAVAAAPQAPLPAAVLLEQAAPLVMAAQRVPLGAGMVVPQQHAFDPAAIMEAAAVLGSPPQLPPTFWHLPDQPTASNAFTLGGLSELLRSNAGTPAHSTGAAGEALSGLFSGTGNTWALLFGMGGSAATATVGVSRPGSPTRCTAAPLAILTGLRGTAGTNGLAAAAAAAGGPPGTQHQHQQQVAGFALPGRSFLGMFDSPSRGASLAGLAPPTAMPLPGPDGTPSSDPKGKRRSRISHLAPPDARNALAAWQQQAGGIPEEGEEGAGAPGGLQEGSDGHMEDGGGYSPGAARGVDSMADGGLSRARKRLRLDAPGPGAAGGSDAPGAAGVAAAHGSACAPRPATGTATGSTAVPAGAGMHEGAPARPPTRGAVPAAAAAAATAGAGPSGQPTGLPPTGRRRRAKGAGAGTEAADGAALLPPPMAVAPSKRGRAARSSGGCRASSQEGAEAPDDPGPGAGAAPGPGRRSGRPAASGALPAAGTRSAGAVAGAEGTDAAPAARTLSLFGSSLAGRGPGTLPGNAAGTGGVPADGLLASALLPNSTTRSILGGWDLNMLESNANTMQLLSAFDANASMGSDGGGLLASLATIDINSDTMQMLIGAGLVAPSCAAPGPAPGPDSGGAGPGDAGAVAALSQQRGSAFRDGHDGDGAAAGVVTPTASPTAQQHQRVLLPGSGLPQACNLSRSATAPLLLAQALQPHMQQQQPGLSLHLSDAADPALGRSNGATSVTGRSAFRPYHSGAGGNSVPAGSTASGGAPNGNSRSGAPAGMLHGGSTTASPVLAGNGSVQLGHDALLDFRAAGTSRSGPAPSTTAAPASGPAAEVRRPGDPVRPQPQRLPSAAHLLLETRGSGGQSLQQAEPQHGATAAPVAAAPALGPPSRTASADMAQLAQQASAVLPAPAPPGQLPPVPQPSTAAPSATHAAFSAQLHAPTSQHSLHSTRQAASGGGPSGSRSHQTQPAGSETSHPGPETVMLFGRQAVQKPPRVARSQSPRVGSAASGGMPLQAPPPAPKPAGDSAAVPAPAAAPAATVPPPAAAPDPLPGTGLVQPAAGPMGGAGVGAASAGVAAAPAPAEGRASGHAGGAAVGTGNGADPDGAPASLQPVAAAAAAPHPQAAPAQARPGQEGAAPAATADLPAHADAEPAASLGAAAPAAQQGKLACTNASAPAPAAAAAAVEEPEATRHAHLELRPPPMPATAPLAARPQGEGIQQRELHPHAARSNGAAAPSALSPALPSQQDSVHNGTSQHAATAAARGQPLLNQNPATPSSRPKPASSRQLQQQQPVPMTALAQAPVTAQPQQRTQAQLVLAVGPPFHWAGSSGAPAAQQLQQVHDNDGSQAGQSRTAAAAGQEAPTAAQDGDVQHAQQQLPTAGGQPQPQASGQGSQLQRSVAPGSHYWERAASQEAALGNEAEGPLPAPAGNDAAAAGAPSAAAQEMPGSQPLQQQQQSMASVSAAHGAQHPQLLPAGVLQVPVALPVQASAGLQPALQCAGSVVVEQSVSCTTNSAQPAGQQPSATHGGAMSLAQAQPSASGYGHPSIMTSHMAGQASQQPMLLVQPPWGGPPQAMALAGPMGPYGLATQAGPYGHPYAQPQVVVLGGWPGMQMYGQPPPGMAPPGYQMPGMYGMPQYIQSQSYYMPPGAPQGGLAQWGQPGAALHALSGGMQVLPNGQVVAHQWPPGPGQPPAAAAPGAAETQPQGQAPQPAMAAAAPAQQQQSQAGAASQVVPPLPQQQQQPPATGPVPLAAFPQPLAYGAPGSSLQQQASSGAPQDPGAASAAAASAAAAAPFAYPGAQPAALPGNPAAAFQPATMPQLPPQWSLPPAAAMAYPPMHMLMPGAAPPPAPAPTEPPWPAQPPQLQGGDGAATGVQPPWSKEEDQILLRAVMTHGTGGPAAWAQAQQQLGSARSLEAIEQRGRELSARIMAQL